MAVLERGDVGLELKLAPLADGPRELDRQLAWELYVAILVRPSVRGGFFGRDDPPPEDAAGEIARFLDEVRGIMARWPVGLGPRIEPCHLGPFLASSTELLLLPFLARWRSSDRQAGRAGASL